MGRQTVITNSCGSAVTLSEGNAGVYRTLKRIPDKGSYPFKVDPNATYRDYLIRVENTKEEVLISSDDLFEYATIEVLRYAGGGIYWKDTASEMKPNPPPGNPPPENPPPGDPPPGDPPPENPPTRNPPIFNRGAWAGFFKLLWNGNSSLR